MGRKRTFTKMLPADAPYMPATRITWKGRYQSDYFSLNKIAEEDFETNGTALARLILSEWLQEYREKKKAGKPTGTQQMVMILRGEPMKKAKPGKVGGK